MKNFLINGWIFRQISKRCKLETNSSLVKNRTWPSWIFPLISLAVVSCLSVQLFLRPSGSSIVNIDAVARRQVLAQQRIQSTCRHLRQHNYNNTGPKRFTHDAVYIDDARQYMYCAVPKVACTNWKRVLLTMSGLKFDDSDPTTKLERLPSSWMHDRTVTDRMLKRIVHFSWPQLKSRLNTHFKFMFVREPLERLLSAYLDQIVLHASSALDYEPEIAARRRRKGSSGENIILDYKYVQFPEFVRVVINSFRQGRTLNRHWRPQHELCQPCYFAYTFIGHYETLYDDADQVLTRLNSVGNPNATVVVDRFPRSDPDNDDHQRTRDIMDRYYSEISNDDVRQLYSLYSVDYEMFGIEHPYNVT